MERDLDFDDRLLQTAAYNSACVTRVTRV